MADDLTQAQAQAELEEAQRAAEAAHSELIAASSAVHTGGATNEEFQNLAIARQSAAIAQAALTTAAATSMEVTQDLADAIEAISDAADDDSLLKSPFDEDPLLAVFVSPLTGQDLQNLQEWRKQVQAHTDTLTTLASQPPHVLPFLQPQILDLQFRIKQLQAQIAVLLEKESKAKQEFDRKNDEILKSAASKRKEVIDDFEETVDKFEDFFKNEGLDKIISKKTLPKFERRAKNYINDEPEILFVAQYVIEGQFVGALLCFEQFRKSTHYEVFKRNTLKDPSAKGLDHASFQRILYLDRQSLREESNNFVPYVKDILGFKDIRFKKVFFVLDTEVKEDRIYEYTIAAADVPDNANQVDYDLILESKGLLNSTTLSDFNFSTLFSWSSTLLGSKDLAWVLSMVNEGIVFFGRPPTEQSLKTLIVDAPPTVGGSLIYVPKNINDILCIAQESASLLGTLDTFKHMVGVLGGLPREFFSAIDAAVDEARNVFIYDKFREELKKVSPVFQLVLDVAETKDEVALNELSQMSIELPIDTGSVSLTTILGLSEIFRFMNDLFIALTYSQEGDSFEKIIEIRALIAINRGEEDPFDEGVTTARNLVVGQSEDLAEGVSAQYNVTLASPIGFQSDDPNVEFAAKGVFGT